MFSFTRKRVIFTIAGLIFLAAVSLIIGSGIFFIRPHMEAGKEQIIIVKGGMSLKQVAGELERKEIISNRTIFRLCAKILGYGRNIKAGEYRLSSRMSPVTILEKLTKGEMITYPVTIPEGFTKEKIADLLDKKKLVNRREFLSLTDNSDLLKPYNISSPSLEGYLYPDTYQFVRGTPASVAVETMVKRFLQVTEEVRKEAEKMGMEKVIILASIVEKETANPAERPIIASVFLNRLKRRMRLDSDPTVIYGIKDFNGNLTRKDLARATPYNTYIIRGLPPGPIANPGFKSIEAVLHPARTDYLYFVSKNNGSHYFSRTLSEHNRAVRIYQKRKRRGSKKSNI